MAGRPKGLPKTGGRKKGVQNKVTREASELFKEYGPEMADRLIAIARNGKHPDHFAAIRDILDRGYGKPKQTQELTGKNGGPIVFETVYENPPPG